MDWLKISNDAAEGALAGSVVPGIGTALGAAGAVALNLAPELSQWMFGSGSEATVAAVQSTLKAVTGTDRAAEQVQALSDPALAGDLRIQLAGIAADRAASAAQAAQDKLVAQLADVANARAATSQLAQAGSSMAWGAAVVSLLVLLSFGAAMTLALLRAIPQNAEPVLNVLLGSLTAMATSVVSYWVGSSAGSARKDARFADYITSTRT